MPDKELTGRVALVTGAGRNIGRSIALSLAAGGAAVIVNTRSNRAEADGVVKEIEAPGGKAMAAVADVVDAPAIEKILAAAVERFGPIDILVNNAALRAEKSLEQMSFEEWRRITGVILDGAFICVKACLPHLKKNGSGAIVNVGMSSHTGAAHRPHVVTAKAGLAGFTRALAHELAGKGSRQHRHARRHAGAASGRPAGAAAPFLRQSAGRPDPVCRTTLPRPCVFFAGRRPATSPARISTSMVAPSWADALARNC